MVFLLYKVERSDWSGGRSGQDEISLLCGVGRTHVPRTLKPLLAEGLIEEQMGRTPGSSRRVKVYSLTAEGIETARGIRSELLSSPVTWKNESGQMHSGTLEDAISTINSTLSNLGMSTIPLSLLLTVQKEMIIWNDILWLSNSIRQDEDPSICIPDGWTPVTPPQRLPFPRERVHDTLDRALEEKRMIVVTGEKGMRKASMVSEWLDRKGIKALWLSPADTGEDICVDSGGYDAVVLLGSDMIEIGRSMLMDGEAALMDPRTDDWPPIFREVPLIGIQDGELDIEIEGVIRISGLKEETYVNELVGKGMPTEMAVSIYKAVKGSPGSLEHILGSGEDGITELIESDVDTAVMMVLMGYKHDNNDSKVAQKTHK